ncbi:MAG: hypothetical protein V4577_15980 [Bacteroidota bacterium]
MKIFLYTLIGVAAIILLTVTVFNYDPETEKWSSLLFGAAVGFGLYKIPSVIRNIRQKKAK